LDAERSRNLELTAELNRLKKEKSDPVRHCRMSADACKGEAAARSAEPATQPR